MHKKQVDKNTNNLSDYNVEIIKVTSGIKEITTITKITISQKPDLVIKKNTAKRCLQINTKMNFFCKKTRQQIFFFLEMLEKTK